jgi:phospholipase C
MSKPNIDHIIVLMMENRSFDHMLGLLPGVNGITTMSSAGEDNRVIVNPNYFNLAEPADPSSQTYPAGEPAQYTVPTVDINRGFGGPGHSFPAATLQLDYSAATSAQVKAPAPLDGFIADYMKELYFRKNPSTPELGEPMTSFDATQMPVIYQLAQEFCVCDHWFSEVPGPTEPNRLFTQAATSTGFAHNVWGVSIQAMTICEKLDQSGHDWAFYYFDQSDSDPFPQLKGRTSRVLKFDSFYQQAKDGTLPTYSFLTPQMLDGKDGSSPNSQHAPYDVRLGEVLIANVYEALRNGPLWESCLLVVTYDEHGGYYDHVPPPAAPQPDGFSSPTAYDKAQAQKNSKQNGYLLKPNMEFDFTRLGLRVPAVLVTPWVAKGTVDSNLYQHTSIMAALRDLYGVGTLTKRDASAASFIPTLSKLSQPRTDAPTTLTRPVAPAPSSASLNLPPTDQEKQIANFVANLDGHKDSGKTLGNGRGQVPLPKTRADLAAYVDERRQAHIKFHRQRRRKASYKVRRHKSGGYHWQLSDEEGNVIAASPKPVPTQAEAEAQIAKIRDLGPYAKQV